VAVVLDLSLARRRRGNDVAEHEACTKGFVHRDVRAGQLQESATASRMQIIACCGWETWNVGCVMRSSMSDSHLSFSHVNFARHCKFGQNEE
jgi:hypothetical protein